MSVGAGEVKLSCGEACESRVRFEAVAWYGRFVGRWVGLVIGARGEAGDASCWGVWGGNVDHDGRAEEVICI